jgi:hypothetical protein
MKKIKSLIIISLMTTVLFGTETKKENNTENVQTVTPISVPGIRYNKGLIKYSLFDTTKEGFKEYTKEEKINGYMLKTLYNRIDNPKSIVLSAFAYDYGYSRPDLAENFYKLFSSTKGIKFEDKLRYIDFLLRTGRVNEIKNNLTKAECISSFKHNSQCYYYLGVASFLTTGDHKNIFLNLARHKESKAKEIFYEKDVK